MPLRLIFMGTPDFAVPTLLALAAAGHEIAAVYTRAGKPAGRGMALQPTPVEREARKLGLPVLTPATLKNADAEAAFRAHKADAAVVVAYGLILPKAILETPRLGCFNIHASLLPRWRGAAPINRAVMAGDKESGVTIMQMDEGLDTGAIVRTKRVRITRDMTAGDLHDLLARVGATIMPLALCTIVRDRVKSKPQPEAGANYAEKISKAEARVDWSKHWRDVHNHVRGLSPFPGAWFELGGVRVKALRSTYGAGHTKSKATPGTTLDDKLTIACGYGAVRLTLIQREGKKPMSSGEFLRGTPIKAGARLL